MAHRVQIKPKMEPELKSLDSDWSQEHTDRLKKWKGKRKHPRLVPQIRLKTCYFGTRHLFKGRMESLQSFPGNQIPWHVVYILNFQRVFM